MRFFTLALLLMIPFAPHAAEQCDSLPLNILLTNDDGFDTDGIKALHRRLITFGHNVKRIAPDRNYSGSAASLTLSELELVAITDSELPNVYAINGSPATSVLVGESILFSKDEPLELLVSGINNGANLGPATTLSGTVGATVLALRFLRPSIAGIAISTAESTSDAFNSNDQYLQHLANVADFIARLISESQCAEVSFLQSGQSLNINYPPLDNSTIKGVRIGRQGLRSDFALKIVALGEGSYRIGDDDIEGGADIDSSDTEAYEQGFITVVPIDGDYSAAPAFDATPIGLLDP
jgi:5'/3'-nucleotidase SurE